MGYIDMDNTPNFDDWTTMTHGGWNDPFEKVYNCLTVCNNFICNTYRDDDNEIDIKI